MSRPNNATSAACCHCTESFSFYPTQSQGKFCSSRCAGDARKQETKERIQRGEIFERATLKLHRVEEIGNVCEICTTDEWMGQPVPLILDHIDGNAANNMPDNIRIICPNCNAQTPTFGARNKGNGRKARGLPLA